MKILMAFNRDLNPYVDVLVSGLASVGCPVETGTDKFWNEELFDHDIVHIQWPETLFDWRVPGLIEMQFLRRRLKEVRSRAKILYTRHNRVSHHINDVNRQVLKDLYSLIESECDAMVHLGQASFDECCMLPDLASKRHVMIPIPVYDELYAPYMGLSKREARRELGIPDKKKVVLAFGNFRFESEKQLVAEALKGLGMQNVVLLAPKWHKSREYSLHPRHPMLAMRSARKAVDAWSNGWRLGAKKVMSDEEVAMYFAASDVVMVQRLNELNSGNVPMGFLFGKIVTGPDGGNIGAWLKESGNPVFKYDRSEGIVNALRQALDLADTGYGEKNRDFARTHWSTRTVSQQTAIFYQKLKK